MALKKLLDTSSAAQFKFEKLEQSLKGYLVASEEFPLNGKMVRKHVFETSKGLVGVLGSTDLNRKVDNIISQFGLGLWVEATYVSNMKTKQPQPMKVYQLAYDEDNRIELGATQRPISAQASAEEPADEEYAPSEEELSEPEAEEEEVVAAPKASPPTRLAATPVQVSKEAQSRVQSVLSRRSTRP